MRDLNLDQMQRVLIVGLGVTGLSVARYLRDRGAGVAVADTREKPGALETLQRECPDVALFLGPFDQQVFTQADLLVVSPGVALATPEIAAAQDAGVPVVGDIELFAHAAKAPIVGITGSNGKSTVTTLVGEMIAADGRKVAVGGNIGTPALDLLDDAVEVYVLELSSFQLETTHSLNAAVACVLNVQADHMDRYRDLNHYAAAKAKIVSGAGLAVLNADDALVMAMQGADDSWTFSLGAPQGEKQFGLRSSEGRDYLMQGDEPLLAADTLLIAGKHNQANALAALAIGRALGLSLEKMQQVLQRFRGLAHRTEFVAEVNGVAWFNDSKATNVGAAIAALRGLHEPDGGRAVIILGGDCKAADFAPLSDALSQCARAAVLIGRDAAAIAGFVPSAIPQRAANDLPAAVTAAAELAQPGDHVLLSPACASFDQFRNFEHRGDMFRSLVGQLSA